LDFPCVFSGETRQVKVRGKKCKKDFHNGVIISCKLKGLYGEKLAWLRSNIAAWVIEKSMMVLYYYITSIVALCCHNCFV
jgi:ribosomal protein L19